MIPLTVAAQVRETILDYLFTTFNLQDEQLETALRVFLEDPQKGLFKGPYIHLRLPYQRAGAGDLFTDAPLFSANRPVES